MLLKKLFKRQEVVVVCGFVGWRTTSIWLEFVHRVMRRFLMHFSDGDMDLFQGYCLGGIRSRDRDGVGMELTLQGSMLSSPR